MDIFNIVVGLAGIISMIGTVVPVYFLLKEQKAKKPQLQQGTNLIVPGKVQKQLSQKRKKSKLTANQKPYIYKYVQSCLDDILNIHTTN